MLTNRPLSAAAIIEDGYKRHYRIDEKYLEKDEGGINLIEKTLLHVLDVGGNYWSLWTEADNLKQYFDKYPEALYKLKCRMGYRLRPSWVWQRKCFGTDELVVGIVNDGVAGVPGILHINVESPDGSFKVTGCLDEGLPRGGGVRLASFILPPDMDGQSVKLSAEIETRGGMHHPVRWACAQPLNPDGSYTIQLRSHNDPGWRKGV